MAQHLDWIVQKDGEDLRGIFGRVERGHGRPAAKAGSSTLRGCPAIPKRAFQRRVVHVARKMARVPSASGSALLSAQLSRREADPSDVPTADASQMLPCSVPLRSQPPRQPRVRMHFPYSGSVWRVGQPHFETATLRTQGGTEKHVTCPALLQSLASSGWQAVIAARCSRKAC